MHTTSLRTLLPFVLLMACASSPPVGRMEARGDLYATRQNSDLARADYIQALRKDPGNARLRQKLEDANQSLITARAREIEEAITRGEPIVAAYTLSKARQEFGRDHQQVVLMDQRVAEGLSSALRVAESNKQFERAFTLHAAMLAYVPQSSSANRQDQRFYRDAWVAQIRKRALDDESQRLFASAALHRYKIFKLTRHPVEQDAARDLRARALAAHVYSVSLLHNEHARLDQRLILTMLDTALARPDVKVLADGSAAAGATFTISARDLRCDTRQELRAPNQVASPRPVMVQRCMTSFSTTLMPTDAYRDERSAERVLTQELAHATAQVDEAARVRTDVSLTDALLTQGAALIAELIAEDLRSSRDRIVERARTFPLERAVLDAQITQLWLEPDYYGTRELLDAIQNKSGFKDAGDLLRHE